MTKAVKTKAFTSIMISLFLFFITMLILGGKGVKTSAENNLDELNRYYESYEIQSGDSLWSICNKTAKEYGIPTDEYLRDLRKLNSMKGDVIIPGQNLLLIKYE